MNSKTQMLIPKIERGIVIDHVPAGMGPKVLDLIRSFPGMDSVVVTLALNCVSTKLGKKDLLKLDIPEFPPSLLDRISLVAPGVTIKRISNFVVDKKYKIEPPERIENLARCRNPNCVTNTEPSVPTAFVRLDKTSRSFRCEHCERVFLLDELAR